MTFNNRALEGKASEWVRQHDNTYQQREGDPQLWTMDKDGLRFVRVIPAASENAPYNEIDGTRGTKRYTTETGVTVVGSRGILRCRQGNFPSGGPWGTPVRHHPDTLNIRVDHYRLGRTLKRYPFELPHYLMKFVYFYAMSTALRREGPGQDIKMADHYMERFEMGVERLKKFRREMQRMRTAQMGARPEGLSSSFGLGAPVLPSYYPVYR